MLKGSGDRPPRHRATARPYRGARSRRGGERAASSTGLRAGGYPGAEPGTPHADSRQTEKGGINEVATPGPFWLVTSSQLAVLDDGRDRFSPAVASESRNTTAAQPLLEVK